MSSLGLQVVTCQRVKKELVEGILESLCDTWRLGAAPALGGGLSESDARVLQTTSERWRD